MFVTFFQMYQGKKYIPIFKERKINRSEILHLIEGHVFFSTLLQAWYFQNKKMGNIFKMQKKKYQKNEKENRKVKPMASIG